MKEYIHIEGARVVNFECLLEETGISTHILNDLHQHQLLNSKLNSTSKRLFYHHIILDTCNYIIKSDATTPICIYYCIYPMATALNRYFDAQSISDLIHQLLHKFGSISPIVVYGSTTRFDIFSSLSTKNGEYIEICENIRNHIVKKGKTRFTYEKLGKFVKQRGLTFLDQSYFNNINVKYLLQTH